MINLNPPLEKIYKRISYKLVNSVRSSLNLRRQRLVVLNNLGEPYEEPKKTLFSLGKKTKLEELEYYVVSFNTQTDNMEVIHAIRNRKRDKSIKIAVEYSLRCPEGNEEFLAQSLRTSAKPQEYIERLITDGIEDFEQRQNENGDSLFEHYALLKDLLRKSIEEILENNLGLEATISISLPDTPKLKALQINSASFSIQFKDWEHELTISYQTEVKVDSQNQVHALSSTYGENDFETLIREKLKILAQDMSVEKFIEIYRTDAHAETISSINSSLFPHGRILTRLKIIPNEKFNRLFKTGLSGNEVDCEIVSLDQKMSMTIHISYEARVLADAQDVAFKRLMYSDPKSQLESYLRHFIKKYVEKYGDSDFIDNFLEQEDILVRHVKGKVSSQLGMNLRLYLEIDGKGNTHPIKITSPSFSVKFSDLNDETPVMFETELEVDKAYRMRAIAFVQNEEKMEELIKEEVKDFLKDNATFTYQSFYSERGRVEQHLIPIINQQINQWGRRVVYFKIRPTETDTVLPELEHKYTVHCEIKRFPREIEVNNRLILNLDDRGKFRKAEIRDLTTWLNKKLESIVKRELFERTYVDVLLRLDTYEQRIKAAIETETREIGYSVMQHLVVPNLPHLKFREEGFKITKDEVFETADTQLQVKLQIILKGEIPDLEAVERFLNNNPDADLEDEIWEATADVIEEELHEVSPQEFYMSFSTPFYSDQLPLDQRLLNNIRQRLLDPQPNKNFGIRNLKITVKQLDTEIKTRAIELQQKRYSIEFELTPWGDLSYGESMKYYINFGLRNVYENGWYIFQIKSKMSLEEQIQDIKDLLKDRVMMKLETLDLDSLQYEDFCTLNEIVKKVIEPTTKIIADKCGVTIEIVSFRRKMTAEDIEDIEDARKRRRMQKKNQNTIGAMTMENSEKLLKQLIKKRNKLLLKGYTEEDEELQQLNKEITKITPELPQTKFEIRERKKRIGEKRKTRLTDFLDAGDQPPLLEDHDSPPSE